MRFEGKVNRDCGCQDARLYCKVCNLNLLVCLVHQGTLLANRQAFAARLAIWQSVSGRTLYRWLYERAQAACPKQWSHSPLLLQHCLPWHLLSYLVRGATDWRLDHSTAKWWKKRHSGGKFSKQPMWPSIATELPVSGHFVTETYVWWKGKSPKDLIDI